MSTHSHTEHSSTAHTVYISITHTHTHTHTCQLERGLHQLAIIIRHFLFVVVIMNYSHYTINQDKCASIIHSYSLTLHTEHTVT